MKLQLNVTDVFQNGELKSVAVNCDGSPSSYRIIDPREVDELGLFDRPEAIVLVEWPERARDTLSGSLRSVTLSIPDTRAGRVAEVAW